MLTRPRTLHRQRHGTITDASDATLGTLRAPPSQHRCGAVKTMPTPHPKKRNVPIPRAGGLFDGA